MPNSGKSHECWIDGAWNFWQQEHGVVQIDHAARAAFWIAMEEDRVIQGPPSCFITQYLGLPEESTCLHLFIIAFRGLINWSRRRLRQWGGSSWDEKKRKADIAETCSQNISKSSSLCSLEGNVAIPLLSSSSLQIAALLGAAPSPFEPFFLCPRYRYQHCCHWCPPWILPPFLFTCIIITIITTTDLWLSLSLPELLLSSSHHLFANHRRLPWHHRCRITINRCHRIIIAGALFPCYHHRRIIINGALLPLLPSSSSSSSSFTSWSSKLRLFVLSEYTYRYARSVCAWKGSGRRMTDSTKNRSSLQSDWLKWTTDSTKNRSSR